MFAVVIFLYLSKRIQSVCFLLCTYINQFFLVSYSVMTTQIVHK